MPGHHKRQLSRSMWSTTALPFHEFMTETKVTSSFSTKLHEMITDGSLPLAFLAANRCHHRSVARLSSQLCCVLGAVRSRSVIRPIRQRHWLLVRISGHKHAHPERGGAKPQCGASAAARDAAACRLCSRSHAGAFQISHTASGQDNGTTAESGPHQALVVPRVISCQEARQVVFIQGDWAESAAPFGFF